MGRNQKLGNLAVAARRDRFVSSLQRPDTYVPLLLAVCAACLTVISYTYLGDAIGHYSTWDYWFDADPARTVEVLTNRRSGMHYTASHHPLFALFFYPPIFVLRLLGLSTGMAFGVVLALASMASTLCAFATLRVLGARMGEAAALTAAMMTSAGMMFWAPVPETFSFGALSILAVVALSAAMETKRLNSRWIFVFAGVIAISVTTTNWTAALAMFLVFLGVWRGTVAAIVSFSAVFALWGLEILIFPATGNFLNVFTANETGYLMHEASGSLLNKLAVFFFHGIILPDPSLFAHQWLSVQRALPGSGGWLSALGLAFWVILFGLALWGIARAYVSSAAPLKSSKTLRVVLLCIAAQLAIALVFGNEAFLYAAHSTPLLVIACVGVIATPARRFLIPLALCLTVFSGLNNFGHFGTAAAGLKAKYEVEAAYTDRIRALVAPGELVVCALNPRRVDSVPGYWGAFEAPDDVIDGVSPETCYFVFDGEVDPVHGWRMPADYWSGDVIDKYADLGARYFITQNQFLMDTEADALTALEQRYRLVERTPDWVIFDLEDQIMGQVQ